MPGMTDEQAIGVVISDWYSGDPTAPTAGEIEKLVSAAKVTDVGRESNWMRMSFTASVGDLEFEAWDVELVDDPDSGEWVVFFDGNGPDDAWIEEPADPGGVFRVGRA